MADHGGEKSMTEHGEDALHSVPLDKTSIDGRSGFAEEVHYGSSGWRSFLSSPYVLGAALLASMGGFSYGYDQGVISLILVMPAFHSQYPQTDPSAAHYGFNTGFMTGMLVLGGFVGCMFYPKIADLISRKWALTVAVVFFDVGAIIQTAAPNYAALVVGRAIGGIGVGTLAMVRRSIASGGA